GTGKTYTLAALATRFIAERDVRASELLMVTFTRAATAELRARVRDRVSAAATRLGDAGQAVAASEGDPLLEHLLSLPEPIRQRARYNLERAVTEFDSATISTIHGFAGQVLGLLGLAEDEAGALVDDNGDLTLAVCADVLATESAGGTDPGLLPSFSAFVSLVQTALGRRGLQLLPEPLGAGAEMDRAVVVRRMVEQAIDEVLAQRRRLGQRSFGDILVRLHDELLGERGAAAAELVRNRYRAALIDEFQDTDPIQWAIFDRLFGSRVVDGGTSTGRNLVLVGDPKQAIYAFRGADVHTYLDAVRDQPDKRSLVTNWRSDGAVLEAVDAIFDGVTFGTDEIGFTSVDPSPEHRERRLVDSSGAGLPAIDLRVRTAEGLARTKVKVGGELSISSDVAKEAVFEDLVDVVRQRLDDGWLPTSDASTEAEAPFSPVPTGAESGSVGYRRVRPSDIAVLVRSTIDAEAVRAALDAQGVPVVLARGSSVLESPAAEQWRWLLAAVARPADARRARMFAISWFGGHDVDWLDDADDVAIATIQQQLWSWSSVLRDAGVEAFVRAVFADSGVIERVLRRFDGDRCATDLEHIAELFRLDPSPGQSTVVGLMGVLDRPQDPNLTVNPNAEFEGDAASRRVASEADAVQVMTVWVAKGLEFPIVCCPTMWSGPGTGDPLVFLDEKGRRCFDLLRGRKWPDGKAEQKRKASADRERDGEALRLLYVALTRAKHQTVLWWARVRGCDKGPLGRVLFGGGSLEGPVDVPGDSTVFERLAELEARAGGDRRPDPVLTVTKVDGRAVPTSNWVPRRSDGQSGPLEEATIGRVLDRRTRRWSFSSISSEASDTNHDVDVPGEPFAVAPVVPERTGEVSLTPEHAISPLATSPAGKDFGLLVHSIYEHVDFAADDLRGDVSRQLSRELSWRNVSLAPLLPPGSTEAEGRDLVIDGVIASIDTPLGPDLGERTLRSFGRRDRLDEVDFELHLPDGGTKLTDRRLGAVLLDHLSTDDPYRPWAERVAAGVYGVDLAGHLTGSIDLVLRVRTPNSPDRFLVVDYKTNRLHDPKALPGVGDYAPRCLHEEMAQHHYPLQALLYSVALHRYLRWRIPAYDPFIHLGGVRYLFVRGMAGPSTARTDGQPHGVCRWDVPPALVRAVSDLLAGRTAGEGDGEPVASTAGTGVQDRLFDGEGVSA
ncbi:MAG: UvrD-helicase domain-containing protein, partial [Acidimicrobiales bacterium]|nr:UvrD-helicase domain-containing protein [Acidimicrobiales bacterium]